MTSSSRQTRNDEASANTAASADGAGIKAWIGNTSLVAGLAALVLGLVESVSKVFGIQIWGVGLLLGGLFLIGLLLTFPGQSRLLSRGRELLIAAAWRLREWHYVAIILLVALLTLAVWQIAAVTISLEASKVALVLACERINATVHAHEAELDELTGQLESAATLHQTQYIGDFPANMRHLTRLIEDASESLVIAVDVPACGAFSNPAAFNDYRKALVSASAKLRENFNLLVYNEATSNAATIEQFGVGGAGWSAFRESPKFKAYYHWKPQEEWPSTPKEFAEDLWSANAIFLEDLRRAGANIRYAPSRFPLFFWVADRSIAAFSLFNYGAEAREVSFHTSISKFVETLLRLGDTYR